ncbi:MAG: WYL domain-containing protein [Treponema sp.]|nr:WYL domain-containing protein [Treponema sp.]
MKKDKKSTVPSPPKSALTRLFYIDQQIASGIYPNSRYLAEYLLDKWGEVSVPTISRDIAFMRDRLYAPIEYDALNRGYYYSEKNYRIPMGFAGADELLALGMAKNILSLYRNTPVYEAANNLLNCITAPLAAEGNSSWFENRIVVPQVPSASVVNDVWEPVTTALKENRILVFEYMGSYDEKYQSRRVKPYQLLFDTGIWYLYGYAEERKETRIFSLCRMKNIVVTTDHFSLPKDFDYRAINAGSYFGIFAGQKRYKFKIAFYDYSIAWVKDRKWADDQKISKADDGIMLTFTSTQFLKVIEWVLSRGCTARPLEPELLVTTWRYNIAEMQKTAS